jgi:hypothetical protein
MMLLSQEGALGMLRVWRMLHHLVQLVYILLMLLGHAARFLLLCLRPPAALVTENLTFHRIMW